MFRTINLADAGVLALYESPSAKDVPPLFKDPSHLCRLGAAGAGHRRARRPREVEPLPNGSIEDLTRPELKGSVAIANPRAGTTSGHVAALYVLWGEPKAEQFFKALRANGAKVLGGNGDVATQVAAGAQFGSASPTTTTWTTFCEGACVWSSPTSVRARRHADDPVHRRL